MKSVLVLLACLNLRLNTGCDSERPQVEIKNIQVQQDGHHYELVFELSAEAFWEVEASDETDDTAAFLTIAQNKPRSKDAGPVTTGPLSLNVGEDYILRVLAYTPEDLEAGRAAMAYAYIDK